MLPLLLLLVPLGFHRANSECTSFVEKHDIDVDVMTAGEYKRTMTVLGENTEKGKGKIPTRVGETHQLNLNNLWRKINARGY